MKPIKKVLLFSIIIIVAISGGLFIQYQETQYKSFFVEKVSVGQNTPTDTTKIDEDETELININTNNIYELDKLYGIGQKMAERIINYRKKHGNFEVIEDIMRVDGIGEETFMQFKDQIYVGN